MYKTATPKKEITIIVRVIKEDLIYTSLYHVHSLEDLVL